VDYLGLAQELREALHVYTSNRGEGQLTYNQKDAVNALRMKIDIVRGLFHGFDWSLWSTGTAGQRMGVLPAAQEFILAQPDGRTRLLQHVGQMSQAIALCITHPVAQAHREEVAFYQAVRAAIVKEPGDADPQPGTATTPVDREAAIKQLVSRAITPGEVIDLFAASGLKKPDISILDENFLASVRDMPHKNLAVELLRKLLSNEVRQRGKKNVVQSRSFAAMLDEAIRRYMNRTKEAEEIVEELIELAREMRQATARGEELNLTEDELAFYDALEVNDSAVAVLGDETLRAIARELVSAVRRNVTIDWTLRENVRAQMRVIVKRILRQYGYPPDKQEKATQTVLEQAEVLCEDWAIAA
jgi:type I restriction enzyme R subunit